MAKKQKNLTTQKQQDKSNTEKLNIQFRLSAEVSNGIVMERMAGTLVPEFTLSNFIEETIRVGKDVNDGDMREIERMLTAQAYALQTMFMSLINKAQAQEYLKQYTAHMQLALKAQAQSRATIQALTELKYPKQVIVTQQANIANQQQVNNEVQPPLCKPSTKAIEESKSDEEHILKPKLVRNKKQNHEKQTIG